MQVQHVAIIASAFAKAKIFDEGFFAHLFTCFISTQFTCFTSTKVQILTIKIFDEGIFASTLLALLLALLVHKYNY